MSLDAFLITILQDPIDRQPLVYVESDNVLFNPRRHVIYDVRGAIPVLLPDEAREATAEEIARYGAPNAGVLTGSN